MRKKKAIVYMGAVLLMLGITGSSAWQKVMADEYRLGPGDEIDMNVWGDQGWQTKQLAIRPDGKLSLAVSLTRSEDYLLGSGDVLDVDVMGYEELAAKDVLVREDGKIALPVSIGNLSDYRFKQGDVLSIGVYRFPDLQVKELVIRPDGKISFPLIGEVTAAETTVSELTKLLTGELANYVKNPQVNVDVIKFHRIPVIKEIAVAGTSLGDMRAILVKAYSESVRDPQVAVKMSKFRPIPISREINATGLTLDELGRKLTELFGEYIKNPKISLNINKFRTLRVYVLGEVTKPGMYEIDKSHNLLDALSVAGGHSRRANKRSVYVVRKATGECQRINLNNLLKKADLSQNVVLAEGDVVYLADNRINFIEEILPYISAVYQIRHM